LKYQEIPVNFQEIYRYFLIFQGISWNFLKYFGIFTRHLFDFIIYWLGPELFYSFYWDTWNVKQEIQGNTLRKTSRKTLNVRKYLKIVGNIRKYVVKSCNTKKYYVTFLCISIFGNTYNFFLMFMSNPSVITPTFIPWYFSNTRQMSIGTLSNLSWVF
jgi:hypothetical protein